VKIKNQSFEPFKNEYNQTINLFYNVRIKGHFEENWTVLYRPVYGIPKQSTDSDYTVFSYTWKEHGDTWLGSWAITLRDGAKADFQVQAMIGRIVDYGPFSAHSPREDFEGETSGWSNTQTITIGTTASPSTSDTSPSTSPSPSPDSSSSSSQDSATATPDQSDNQAVSETDLYEIAVTASIALAVIVALTAGIMFVRGRSRRRGAQREQAFV
jgi:hypothetical protein